MTDLFALDPKHAEESENLASLSSGALQQKLHEVNELQRQSEYLSCTGFIDYRLLCLTSSSHCSHEAKGTCSGCGVVLPVDRSRIQGNGEACQESECE